jgi:hypothetical protein
MRTRDFGISSPRGTYKTYETPRLAVVAGFAIWFRGLPPTYKTYETPEARSAL